MSGSGAADSPAAGALDGLGRLTGEITAHVADQAEALRHGGARLADDRKTAAAAMLRDIADALRLAAQQLTHRERAAAADLVGRAADRLGAAAATLRDRNLAALLDEARQLAGRQPELVFTGALTLGFLFSRVVRSPAARHGADTTRAGAPRGDR